uniref:Banna VP6 n=1 Tax=Banna virus TaxID=77763 RepID=A0A1L3KP06_BANNV|nr:Banna VP6 [Banna virus]
MMIALVQMKNMMCTLKVEEIADEKDDAVAESEELIALREENAKLRKENDELKTRLHRLESDWVTSDIAEKVADMDAQFTRIGEMMDKMRKPMLFKREGIELHGDLLARVEGLLRIKNERSEVDFDKDIQCIVGHYFADAEKQQNLEKMIKSFEYDDIADTIALRLTYFIEDPGLKSIIYAMCKAAVLNQNYLNIEVQEIVDVTLQKYTHNARDDINFYPMFTFDANVPEGVFDHIYKKHYLSPQSVALAHALSHLDVSVNGDGIALYHIGSATRFAECSVVYVDGRAYKPIRVMAEYAIFPTLPHEYKGRVEGLLLLHGGLAPITLVRRYHDVNVGGLVVGSISVAVSTLLRNCMLYSFDAYFTPNGLCINATGNNNLVNVLDIDCCGRAFGKAPPEQSKWNKNKFMGHRHGKGSKCKQYRKFKANN